jgi:hypothetical protein
MNKLDIEQAITDARINRWQVVIEKAKAFAQENYNKGFDFYVECYEQEDWLEEVAREDGTLRTWSEVKKGMKRRAALRDSARADAQDWGF